MAGKKAAKKRTTTAKRTKDTTPVNARRAGPRAIAAALLERGPSFWGSVMKFGEAMQAVNARPTHAEPRTQH